MIYQVKALDYSVGQVSANLEVSHSTVQGVAIIGRLWQRLALGTLSKYMQTAVYKWRLTLS